MRQRCTFAANWPCCKATSYVGGRADAEDRARFDPPVRSLVGRTVVRRLKRQAATSPTGQDPQYAPRRGVPLRLFNTLGGKLQEFASLEPGRARV
jgi:hypothetical protein